MVAPFPRSPALASVALLGAAANGGGVLALELWAAARLAPAFGSGLDVWAAVLAVTFAALALGYLVGSWRTARWASASRAALLFGACALAVQISAWIATRRLAPDAAGTGSDALLLAAVLVLAPPIAILAVLGPWLVELHHRGSGGGGAGRSAGLVYAASTVGGVLTALGVGFHALPCWGLHRTAIAIAVLLLLAAVALVAVAFAQRGRAAQPAALVLLVAALCAVSGESSEVAGRHVLAVHTGLRGRLVVTDDGVHRVLWANGIPQTRAPSPDVAAVLGRDLFESGNALGLIPYLRPEGGSVLVVGLGGGTVAEALHTRGWEVEGVDVDAQVVRVARTFFGYEGHCAVRDGRRYLRSSRRRHEAIVVDVYRGENLPPHLVTREFFALVRDRLTENGLLALNLIGRANGPDVRAVVSTVRTAFPEVVLLAPRDDALAPLTLFAAAVAVEHESTEDRLHAAGLVMPRHVDLEALPANEGMTLTDDRNPIALLRRPTARAWRRSARAAFDLALGTGDTR